MALEQHSGFYVNGEDIELRVNGDVVLKLGADGNIYIKGRILKIT